MNIKEVEALLSISRANVRYYEKEGLLAPTRKDNNYRDYSDEDVSNLKKILVLRKIGFTIEEIAAMQKGTMSLDDALGENIRRLQQTIDDLHGALEVALDMQKRCEQYDTMDEDGYWNIITGREKNGKRFADACRDYADFEIELFDNLMSRVFLLNFFGIRRSHGIALACVILLGFCTVLGFCSTVFWEMSFWVGFLLPFVIFSFGSILLLPIYFRKKIPKLAELYAFAVVGLFVLFLLFVAFLVLLGGLDSLFHFL